ncbi:hypothetical protein HYALB_00008446 [Hymenoscyphus albidus]|uniref:Homing endonuclease LAGLIDADG domain-containing protein n=1 Tax=Hymenoscyphus albidus TaxID=595503 RepID=A0A9N9Q210_9HELO|nr:hypothetical protein HYALB_00008446 [Hymenoscyphus albidus]
MLKMFTSIVLLELKLVLILAVLVKNPKIRMCNQPVTNDRSYSSHLVGTSETTRAISFGGSKETRFNQWLAGLIDGDGSLQVSKAGYSSCEITVALADERMLRIIQNKLGGSIKPRSGVQAIRWRLHNRQGMLKLINRINGYIRHSSRLVQLNRVCTILNVELLSPDTLHIKHGWFAGFFDADGTIGYYFKGIISKDGPESFNLRVRSREDLNKVIKHFDQYPLISKKRADFDLFKDAFFIVKNKQHITKDDLVKIAAIKGAMNLGLSDLLKNSFPDIPLVERPLVKYTPIRDPQ